MSTIRLFLEVVDISQHHDGSGMMALHIASSRGGLEIVELLVQHGFENLHNCYNDCMHIAAAKGHTNVVGFFLDNGVDVNCKFNNVFINPYSQKFWEDLEYVDSAHLAPTNAARRGDYHMFCFLVRRGSRVDVEGGLGALQQCWLGRIEEWDAKCLQ